MSAVISPCGAYRYRLERKGLICGGKTVAVIMVNPSTADAEADDATIRKLRGFSLRNGWGRIIVGNLFAYRSTDVRALGRASDPIGPENDAHLRAILADADDVVFAWGPLAKQPKQFRGLRWRRVYEMANRPVYSLGAPAKDGHPRHPLMLGYDQSPQRWLGPSPFSTVAGGGL